MALSDILERALLLLRMLISGSKEPNVAANGLAVQAVNQQTMALQQEVDNLKTDLEIRQLLANNSPMAIIERARARTENSRGVIQGDVEADRLNQLQKPASEQ